MRRMVVQHIFAMSGSEQMRERHLCGCSHLNNGTLSRQITFGYSYGEYLSSWDDKYGQGLFSTV